MECNNKYPSEIIIVTNPAVGAGVARVQKELIEEWQRIHIHIKVLQIVDDRSKEDIVNNFTNDDVVTIICLEKNKLKRFVSKYKKTKDIILKNPNAIIIAMTRPAANLMGIMSLFIENKVVVSERNDPASYPVSKIGRLCRNIAFLFPDICVFQTAMAKNYFPKCIQKKGIIIPNPINPKLPERYNGTRRKAAVAVGRLHEQKNYPMMFKAFKLFFDHHQEYDLEIYGAGNLESELRDLAVELEIDEHVKFMGYIENVYDAIKDATMFLSSSDYEGISNSMLEAMALGLPVICTDCPAGGAKEMIKNNENGILVSVGNHMEMYESMGKVADNPQFAEHLGNAAYKIRETYPVSKIAVEWLIAIEQ